MKIRTYVPSEEKVIRLALFDDGRDSGVGIHIVDEAGHPISGGCIAVVTKSGKIRLQDSVADGHGMELDPDGQIVVYDSDNNRMVPLHAQ